MPFNAIFEPITGPVLGRDPNLTPLKSECGSEPCLGERDAGLTAAGTSALQPSGPRLAKDLHSLLQRLS